MDEIYKIKNNLNSPITDFTFERRNNAYNLGRFQEFAEIGLETVNYRSPQLFSTLPES